MKQMGEPDRTVYVPPPYLIPHLCPLTVSAGNLDFEAQLSRRAPLLGSLGSPAGNWMVDSFNAARGSFQVPGRTGQSLRLPSPGLDVTKVSQVFCVDSRCSYEFCFWSQTTGNGLLDVELLQTGSAIFPSAARGDAAIGLQDGVWTLHCLSIGTPSAPFAAGVDQVVVTMKSRQNSASLMLTGEAWVDDAEWRVLCGPTPTPLPTVAPMPAEPLLEPLGNYPIPFGEEVRIGIKLREAAIVRLAYYNVAGEPVCTQSFDLPAGRHALAWTGVNNSGRRLASGTYPLKIEATTPQKERAGLFMQLAIKR